MIDDFTEDRFDGSASNGNGQAPGGAAKKAKRARKSKGPQGTHSNGAAGAQSAHDAGAAGTQGAQGSAPASGECPAHLLVVPGLVGEIAKFVTDSAQQPQPLWSLGTALTVVGVAAGRHLGGPTKSGTHLYVVILGETGEGKDHPRAMNATLLKASGMAVHVGASQFMSMPSVVSLLQEKPLSVCAMDEIGGFLKRINHKKAGEYTPGIATLMSEMWGSSFQTYPTPQWASKRTTVVEAPAMSIFGTSTPDAYFSALESANIVDGSLNRFILLATDAEPEERDPAIDFHAVPKSIVKGLQDIYRRCRGAPNDATVAPPVKYLGWAAEAKLIYVELKAEMKARGKADKKLKPFLARTAENAIRLATIRAIGCSSMTVDEASMIWARDFMLWAAYRMAESAGMYIADSENQTIANAIKRALKGNGRMPWSVLLRKLNHKYDSRALDGALGQLVQAEEVEEEKTSTGKPGPVPRFYTLK